MVVAQVLLSMTHMFVDATTGACGYFSTARSLLIGSGNTSAFRVTYLVRLPTTGLSRCNTYFPWEASLVVSESARSLSSAFVHQARSSQTYTFKHPDRFTELAAKCPGWRPTGGITSGFGHNSGCPSICFESRRDWRFTETRQHR